MMKSVLFIGAHTDDIEHGAGGLLTSCLEDPECKVTYLTFSKCTDLERNKGILEDQKKVTSFLSGRGAKVSMLDFPNRELPKYGKEIREALELHRDDSKPDLVLTHWSNDLHQDHKVVAEETLRVFRNVSVLSYSVIHSCPNFYPNYFYPLSKKTIKGKLDLLSLYSTQIELYYNRPEVVEAQALHLGAEIKQDFAEGFIVNRLVNTRDLPCV